LNHAFSIPKSALANLRIATRLKRGKCDFGAAAKKKAAQQAAFLTYGPKNANP
jgi:hypothetical protein